MDYKVFGVSIMFESEVVIRTITAQDERNYVFSRAPMKQWPTNLLFREGRETREHRLRGYFVSAKERRKRIGHVFIDLTAQSGFNLFVKKEYRSIGVGQALIFVVVEDLKWEDIKIITATTKTVELARYYQKLGAKEIGKNKKDGFVLEFEIKEIEKRIPANILIGAKK